MEAKRFLGGWIDQEHLLLQNAKGELYLTTQQDSKWLSFLPDFVRKRIEGRHNLQNIIHNTGWLLFDKILRMGVGLIVGVWVARYLGPEQFGAFNFAIAFVALFGSVASLGLDGIVIRDIVREPGKKHEILSSAFLLKLCGGSVAFLISVLAIYIMRPAESNVHWLVGIIAAGMIFQSFDTIDLWFQSQVLSKYTVIAKNAAFIVFALVRVILIVNKAPLAAFALSAFAEIILGAVFLTAFYLRQMVDPVWCPKMETARCLVKESWPVILSGIGIMIYIRIDQVMLGQMRGNKDVGVYSAALRFSEIWYFIPVGIVNSVMPSLTKLRQESEKRYFQRTKQLFKILVAVAYAIAIPMTFLSSFLITSFYGQEYREAGTVLSIHIWTAVFVFLGTGMSPWIANEKMFHFAVFQTWLGAIINFTLNLLFIPLWGAIGVAIATLISQIFAAYLALLVSKKTRVIFRLETQAILLR